jgi:hypothetical protein
LPHYLFKKPDDGGIYWADLIGRFTVGAIVGVIVWVIEVAVIFRASNDSIQYGGFEGEDEWSPDVLLTFDYLAAPLLMAIVVMLIPSILPGLTSLFFGIPGPG